MNRRQDYWRDESGAGAAEFAIVLIPFLALIFAIINMSLMLYANQTLQYATEVAARCYSVDALNCSDTGSTVNWAKTHYKGPALTTSFSASNAGCGHTVTGTTNYPLNAVVYNTTVTLRATSCFP